MFRGSLISRILRIWHGSQNYFNENFDGHGSVYDQRARSRNYFNEISKNKNSRKIRPAKYKRHTVLAGNE